jgi:hypothetical protein
MALFSRADQRNIYIYRCECCGSTDIARDDVHQPWRMPRDIKGYVMPDEPEHDDFGPITTRTTRATRTVRCR